METLDRILLNMRAAAAGAVLIAVACGGFFAPARAGDAAAETAASTAPATVAEDENESMALKYRQQCREALDAGDTAAADSVITEALLYVNGPAKADVYAMRALVNFRAGKTADAFDDAERAVALAPDRPLPVQTRGTLFSDTGEYGMAIPDMDRAIELGTDDPEAYTLRGSLYLMRNNTKAALDMFETALGLDPGNIGAMFQRAYAFSLMGRTREALTAYEGVAAADPDNAFAYNDLGIMKSQLGMLDEAIADFGKAVSLDPKYSSAYSNLGYTLFEKGDTKGAMEQYDRATEIDKSNAYAICNRAEAMVNLGRVAYASSNIKKCLKAADADPAFSEQEAYYFEALRRLKKDLDGGGGIPEYAKLVADAERQLANDGRADAYYSYTVAHMVSPADGEALFGLGKTSLLLGRYQRAVSFLGEYAGVFPGGPHADEAVKLLETARAKLQ